jgi:hypothetical protein
MQKWNWLNNSPFGEYAGRTALLENKEIISIFI